MNTEPEHNASPPVDMSPEAIAGRLREVGQLFQLGMALRRCQPAESTMELPEENDDRTAKSVDTKRDE